MPIENGRDFIFAIRSAAPNELLRPGWDDDAGDFLDKTLERILRGLDQGGATGLRREKMIFYEGMLKGVQLQLRGHAAKGVQELAEANALPPGDRLKADS